MPGRIVLASLLIAGCQGEKPKPQSAPPITSTLPADAAAVERAEATEQQAAKQRAIDNARKAGVMELLKDRAPGEPPRPPGPPDAWWNRKDPCPSGTSLKIEPRGMQEQIACVDPDGAFHGRYAQWDRMSDALWSEATYAHGKLHGVHTLYSRGQKLFEFTYAEGKADGPYTVYTNGRVALRGSYKQDKRDGKWTEVDAAGKVTATMPFKEGKPHGTWTGAKDGRSWRLEFKDGLVAAAQSSFDGMAVPAAELAGREPCERMAARYRAESRAGDAIDSMEPFIYAECHTRRRSEVDCVLASKDKQQADACLTTGAAPR